MSDRGGGSGDLGEGTRESGARLRLPARQLRAKRVVSMVEHIADLGSGTEISWRKPLPHSGHVQVAHVSRVVLVAASSSTRRIVSTSSAAVSASAGRTADGEFGERNGSSSGSDLAITSSRCRAFRFFVWSPLAMTSWPSSAARAAWYAQNWSWVATERHGSPLRSRAEHSAPVMS